jgi:hypothetical protein
MGRQSKIRRERRENPRKPVRPTPPAPKDLRPPSPYDSAEDAQADVVLVHEALLEHHGVDRLPDNYRPTFFEEREDGAVYMAPWTALFRDKLVAKYGSLEVAEPRIRYTLSVVMGSVIANLSDDELDAP